MVDQRNHLGWPGAGAIALVVGLSAATARGAAPSSTPGAVPSSLAGVTVPGGSGSISVTGHLVNSSCAVSVDKNSDEFTLSQTQLQAAKAVDVLITLPFTFTLSQCTSTPLTLVVRLPSVLVDACFFGDFNSVSYRLFLSANSINKEQWQTLGKEGIKPLEIGDGGDILLYNYNLRRSALLFTPRMESEQFTINMIIYKSSVDDYNASTVEVEDISTTFTYEFTYF